MANATMEMTKAEQNALSVSYDVLGTHVELDLDFVKRYLVRGNADKINDQDVLFFMNTCKVQRLNPLVNGEVYLIKYGNDSPQIVIGKGAYLRRAVENPDYLCKEDGIVVLRGNSVVQKEGTCLYPGEKLIGGWCRVHYMRNGTERSAYKEVAFSEYDKGQANWKSKPATMITKVAVSQCVREAFPKDYEGLYSEEEMVASGAIPADFTVLDNGEGKNETVVATDDPPITEDQRRALFALAKKHLGENANAILRQVLDDNGIESTANVPSSAYRALTERIMEIAMEMRESRETADEPPEEA